MRSLLKKKVLILFAATLHNKCSSNLSYPHLIHCFGHYRASITHYRRYALALRAPLVLTMNWMFFGLKLGRQ